MPVLSTLSVRLQNHPKRVVFPEGNDIRIIKAARQFATRKLGVPILLGDKAEISALAAANDVRMDGIGVIDPIKSDDYPEILKAFDGIRRFKKLGDTDSAEMLANHNYYATMMLLTSRADAMVSGATLASSSALRPMLQLIPMQQNVKSVSSIIILDTKNPEFGTEGCLFMSDCGVIPEPTQDQLCDIAYTTANLAKHITNKTPKVAFLSYSSKSATSRNPNVIKMKAAASLLHERVVRENLDFEVDGELQIDVALSKNYAQFKGVNSSVAGSANVLIFPDLNAGNLAVRMSILTNPQMSYYGQILTGLQKPAAEISRSATVNDIYGTAVIVAAQAVDRKYLFPDE